MPAPVVSSVAYDKQAYNPGDKITVTVQGMAGSQVTSRNVTGTGQFTDTATGLTGTLAGVFSVTGLVEDATTGGFTDSDGRIYTQVSINQTPAGVVTAVFTATA